MTYIHYENYRGGVNNLCVARDSATGQAATSTKGKARALHNLHRKNKKYRREKFEQVRKNLPQGV